MRLLAKDLPGAKTVHSAAAARMHLSWPRLRCRFGASNKSRRAAISVRRTKPALYHVMSCCRMAYSFESTPTRDGSFDAVMVGTANSGRGTPFAPLSPPSPSSVSIILGTLHPVTFLLQNSDKQDVRITDLSHSP